MATAIGAGGGHYTGFELWVVARAAIEMHLDTVRLILWHVARWAGSSRGFFVALHLLGLAAARQP